MEMGEARLRMDRKIDCRQLSRDRLCAPYQQAERFCAVQTPIILVKTIEEAAAVGVHEALQVDLASRVVRVSKQLLPLNAVSRCVVIRDVAQDADEGKVHRVLERALDGRIVVVLPGFEIAEALIAAAGE